jgi:hypothetical protein
MATKLKIEKRGDEILILWPGELIKKGDMKFSVYDAFPK